MRRLITPSNLLKLTHGRILSITNTGVGTLSLSLSLSVYPSVPYTHPAEGLPDAVVLLTQTGADGDLEGLRVRVRKKTPLAAQGLLHRAIEREGEGERERGRM